MRLKTSLTLIFSLVCILTYSQSSVFKMNTYYRIEGIIQKNDSVIEPLADSIYYFIKFSKQKFSRKILYEIRVSSQKSKIDTACCYLHHKEKTVSKINSPYCYFSGKVKFKNSIISFFWPDVERIYELFISANKVRVNKLCNTMKSELVIFEDSNNIIFKPKTISDFTAQIVISKDQIGEL